MIRKRLASFVACIVLLMIDSIGPRSAYAADSKAQMTQDAQTALQQLYRDTPTAKVLGEKAAGVLVFPRVTKGGFIVGGQYGEGTLFKDGKAEGFYNIAAASYGLQAGLQKFGYALFFMSDADLRYLDSSGGWELGVGPTMTIVDEGFARSISTSTAREGVYAFSFSHKGLMAGLGLQGSKITRLEPKS
jgi:lipid-binding SYLF domain-containing protein